ncbi:MAG: cytochrome c biogenesis protein CcsA [Alcanivoracaceae bacterium]|nr:cytochrome c biogenesis protein CcsA [Alcanivoracaceae bacterium]
MLVIIILSALFYLFWLLPKSGLRLSNYLGFFAWLLHAVVCFYSLFDEHGWKLNIANAVLLVSWLSVMIVFIFKINSRWVKIPLVIFVLASFSLLDLNPVLAYHHYIEFSWQLDLHVSLSMLSYSVLSVATLYAVSLWIHIKKIKNPHSIASSGLVSLMEEERKLFHIIFLGWLILSTSLLSGVIFIENFMEQHLGHKVVFSILAWLIFGILILGRMTKGWRGEKLISLTIMGMTLLATGYLGSKIILEWII